MRSFFAKINIWRKFTIGLTGLGLAGFLLFHMLGNLTLYLGEEAYNTYSHRLNSIPGIEVVKILLLLIFAIHAVWALALAFLNYQAKGSSPQKDSTNTFVHKTLWLQGTIILVFVILHLSNFKNGPSYPIEYDGTKMRDLSRLVIEVFQNPVQVFWYVLSLIILSFHLNHGLQASFRSLGFYHEKYTPTLQTLGLIYTVVIILGFISLPLYVFFFQGVQIGF